MARTEIVLAADYLTRFDSLANGVAKVLLTASVAAFNPFDDVQFRIRYAAGAAVDTTGSLEFYVLVRTTSTSANHWTGDIDPSADVDVLANLGGVPVLQAMPCDVNGDVFSFSRYSSSIIPALSDEIALVAYNKSGDAMAATGHSFELFLLPVA